MSKPPPPGIYVPAVLFFDENEELDEEAIEKHVLRLAQGSVTGILVQGSNGEAQHLSHDERKRAIRLTRDTLDSHGFKHVLVIAGTGTQSARETKQLNIDAKEAGASYALVLTPSTWRPAMTKEVILRFHREVADVSPIPTLVYNFPTVTAGLDLDSDTLAELGEHPNIVGTKLSCGHLGKLTRLVTSLPANSFATFIGRSDSFLPALAVSGAGGIMALVNVVPRAHRALLDAWHNGLTEDARKIQGMLAHGDAIASKYGGISFIKALIAHEFGYGGPTVRSPLATASIEKLSGADKALLKELIVFEQSLSESGHTPNEWVDATA
ncbi:aldolase [Multifurca ochricompacta]|uniref:Aldolase n=1 Tax=Multifurca ochricompacta TaxID=376703 RepID=A0AAD4QPW6_9AGAM|nr:aldolase [Multifurca ochricompacta]